MGRQCHPLGLEPARTLFLSLGQCLLECTENPRQVSKRVRHAWVRPLVVAQSGLEHPCNGTWLEDRRSLWRLGFLCFRIDWTKLPGKLAVAQVVDHKSHHYGARCGIEGLVQL